MLDLTSLAGIALRTSLLIVAGGLLSLVLRRQSAALRHLLWTSTLALCVLMPLAVLLLPSYSVATIHADAATLIPSSVLAAGPEWGQDAASVLLILWLLGTSIILTREAFANIGLARWQRRARPLESAGWARTLSALAATSGFDSRVRVLESNQVTSPCMWGVLHPVLLLPSIGNTWPESARRGALLHELAHVERRDALSTFVSRLACAIHWYNPLVWLAAARIRNLQEHACDDAVLRAGAIPTEYAQFLVDTAAHMSGITASARTAIGMTHGSSLRTRIVAILDPNARRVKSQRTPALATCASLLGVMIFLATATVASQTDVPAPVAPPARDALQEIPRAPGPPAPDRTAPIPEIPALPAIPSIPAIPATPAIPAIPEIPAESPAPPTD